MKEKMLSVIQEVVDYIRKEQEDGEQYLQQYLQEQYRYYAMFYEGVTGKKVTINNWKVEEVQD